MPEVTTPTFEKWQQAHRLVRSSRVSPRPCVRAVESTRNVLKGAILTFHYITRAPTLFFCAMSFLGRRLNRVSGRIAMLILAKACHYNLAGLLSIQWPTAQASERNDSRSLLQSLIGRVYQVAVTRKPMESSGEFGLNEEIFLQ